MSEPAPKHSRFGPRLKLAIRLLAIAAVVAAMWWFVRELDVDMLGNALASARVWPLVVGAVLHFVMLWGKAACWRIMLAPKRQVPLLRLFRYTIAAFGASAIMPARAGEVLRVWVLERRDGVPVAETAAVAVAEKLLDGITLLVIVAPVPWLMPGLPTWVASALALSAGVAVIGFVALWIAVGRVDPEKPGRIRRFIGGMHVLRSPRRLLGASAALVLTWLADLALVLLALYAVGIDGSLALGLLCLFTINLAITVPSTPAQVGALEVGALAALDLAHVPREPALAFALLYHAVQILPLIVVALVLELKLVLGRDR